MSKKLQKVTKTSFEDWCQRMGMEKDRFGSYRFFGDHGKINRFKIKSLVVRREIKTASGWRNLSSKYFKDLKLNNGVLEGMYFNGTNLDLIQKISQYGV